MSYKVGFRAFVNITGVQLNVKRVARCAMG